MTRLRASDRSRALLERTLSDWHEACRLATGYAWPHTTDARTIQSMTYATHTMGRATQNMQTDMGRLSYSVGRPMSFMNAFIPW